MPQPAGSLADGYGLAPGDASPRLSIRPAGRDGFDLPLPVVTVQKASGGAGLAPDALIVTPVIRNLPAALWGKPSMENGYLVPPELNEKDRTLPGLVGWRFTANDPKPADTAWHPASDFRLDNGVLAPPVMAFGAVSTGLGADAATLLAALPPIGVIDLGRAA